MRPRRLALAALLAAAGCGGRGAPVHLVVAGPLTGPLGAEGLGLQHAVQLAIEDEEAAGGLPPVELKAYDDKSDPGEAASVARLVADDPQVFAVIGHLNSGCSIEASRVYARAGVPMITPTATATQLTEQQDGADWSGERVVFRLPPSDAKQGEALAEYAAKRLSLKRVAVAHDTTPYGEDLAAAFQASLDRRGVEIVKIPPFPRGTREFAGPAAQVAAAKADGLFYAGSWPDAGPFIKQARAAGYKGVFMGGDGVKNPDIFEAAGPAFDGAYVSVSGIPIEAMPGAADFVERYQKRFESAPRPYDLYGYDAARVALAALRKVGPDRRKAIEAIRNSRVRGFTGDIVFDAKGDSVRALVSVAKADYAQRRFELSY